MLPPREPAGTSLRLAVEWTLLIFLAIPVARGLREAVSRLWGREWLGYFAIAGIVAATLVALLVATRRRGGAGEGGSGSRVSRVSRPWLALVGATYAGFALAKLRTIPEEGMHFLLYGVLGVLVCRALSHRVRDPGVYLGAAILCTLVGTFDEILQWLAPGRYWDFADLGINAIAGGLAQVGIAIGVRPRGITRPVQPATARLVLGLAALQLALLTLCVANTPARIESYATSVPGLAGLTRNPSVMVEYGFRHEDPEVGVWFSRFGLASLAELDRTRGVAAAAILDAYPAERYPQFHEIYRASVEPFVHEARVHLFRRDRYLADGLRMRAAGDGRARGFLDVAARENLLLERHFPSTLAHSGFRLDAAHLRVLTAARLPGSDYESAVGRHLVTRIPERTLVLLLASLTVFATALALAISRRQPKG